MRHGTALLAIGVTLAAAGAHAGFETVIDVPPDAAPAAIASNTQLNLSAGGVIGQAFQAGAVDGTSTNVEVNISGGLVGDIFRSHAGSRVRLSGGDYRLDGAPIEGLDSVGASLTATPPEGTVLSGTLADGTPFAFSTLDGDLFAAGTLTLTVTDLPATGPGQITVPGSAPPQGIRSGQTLLVETGGGVGPHFAAGAGSTVMVTGGQVGDNLEAVGAVVTISGGTVGDRFDALIGSQVSITGGTVGALADAAGGSAVNIAGGSVGSSFDAFAGSQVTITGGSVGDRVNAFDGSVVTIAGGAVGGALDVFGGSLVSISSGSIGNDIFVDGGAVLNITGGTVGNDLDALAGSTVNLSGNSFFINGVQIEGLDVGDSMTVSQRNVTLSGTLGDDSPFRFELNNENDPGEDFFDPAATLTITLVAPGVLGDYNQDGVVNAADYVVWRNHAGTAFHLPNRDPNLTGIIDQGDYDVWVNNFGNTSGSGSIAAVPEPTAAVTATFALLTASLFRKRRATT